MRVRFTPSADRQWIEALEYICRDRPGAALSLLDRLDQALSRLVAYPDSGRCVPEFPRLSIREVLVSPYRFFYRVDDGVIWIVAVWHDAQVAEEPAD